MRRDERSGLLFAACAVAFFSTSPVLTLWADPLSPFVKTGGRLGVAALVLGLVLLVGRARRAPAAEPVGEIAPLDARLVTAAPAPRSSRMTVARFALYGLIAALHFLGYV